MKITRRHLDALKRWQKAHEARSHRCFAFDAWMAVWHAEHIIGRRAMRYGGIRANLDAIRWYIALAGNPYRKSYRIMPM